MYYQVLSNLDKQYNTNLIEKYDKWFFNLSKSEEEKITINKLANALAVEFDLAKELLEESVKINILERRYAIKCPECDHIISIVTIDELYDTINSINSCDACETENLEIDDTDIQIIYKKKIKDVFLCEEQTEYIIKKISNEIKKKQDDTLKSYLDNKLINPNDIFYNPTEEERRRLKELFMLIGKKSKNTTEKGEQLRVFTEYLLRLVKIFESANLKTRTNELDCVVKNKVKFIGIPHFLNDIGFYFIVECKNEKKKPNNTYILKLKGILDTCNKKCGVIVSIMEQTKDSKILANKFFLAEKLHLININYKDLENVVYNNLNFLDLFENKIMEVELDTTTSIINNEVFKK